MKIQYQNFNFRDLSLALISQANKIIDEYQAEGYELTIRQLYYQFVARGILPNKPKEYGRLGNLVNKGRLAGLIDWAAIVDRTRKIEINSHWGEPSEILQSAADSYALDTRITQEVYLEVWIEKEALAGVLERVCVPLDIPYFSCRGYVSQSAMWRAAQRIVHKLSTKHHCRATILHLGDHDPSGIDMTRDIRDRLKLFECDIEINRIALNMEQVKKYKPPPNPAKLTDTRCQGYIAEYGDESWELDALDPQTITNLIEHHESLLTDFDKRDIQIKLQEEQRGKLQTIADEYDDLSV